MSGDLAWQGPESPLEDRFLSMERLGSNGLVPPCCTPPAPRRVRDGRGRLFEITTANNSFP